MQDRKYGRIERIRATYRMARKIAAAMDAGFTLIPVPNWLAPEVNQLIWARNVERASNRWAEAAPEIDLGGWRQAYMAAGERMKGPDDAA